MTIGTTSYFPARGQGARQVLLGVDSAGVTVCKPNNRQVIYKTFALEDLRSWSLRSDEGITFEVKGQRQQQFTTDHAEDICELLRQKALEIVDAREKAARPAASSSSTTTFEIEASGWDAAANTFEVEPTGSPLVEEPAEAVVTPEVLSKESAAPLLGRYRVINLATLRTTPALDSDETSHANEGDVIQVKQVAVLPSGVVRLRSSGGWLTLKPHLLEKITADDIEDHDDEDDDQHVNPIFQQHHQNPRLASRVEVWWEAAQTSLGYYTDIESPDKTYVPAETCSAEVYIVVERWKAARQRAEYAWKLWAFMAFILPLLGALTLDRFLAQIGAISGGLVVLGPLLWAGIHVVTACVVPEELHRTGFSHGRLPPPLTGHWVLLGVRILALALLCAGLPLATHHFSSAYGGFFPPEDFVINLTHWQPIPFETSGMLLPGGEWSEPTWVQSLGYCALDQSPSRLTTAVLPGYNPEDTFAVRRMRPLDPWCKDDNETGLIDPDTGWFVCELYSPCEGRSDGDDWPGSTSASASSSWGSGELCLDWLADPCGWPVVPSLLMVVVYNLSLRFVIDSHINWNRSWARQNLAEQWVRRKKGAIHRDEPVPAILCPTRTIIEISWMILFMILVVLLFLVMILEAESGRYAGSGSWSDENY